MDRGRPERQLRRGVIRVARRVETNQLSLVFSLRCKKTPNFD
jgi:hypothetical protein